MLDFHLSGDEDAELLLREFPIQGDGAPALKEKIPKIVVQSDSYSAVSATLVGPYGIVRLARGRFFNHKRHRFMVAPKAPRSKSLAVALALAALALIVANRVFAFEPTMSLATDKSSRPIVFGTTNLPDGTQLMVLITKQHGGYAAESKVTVAGGHFAREQFSDGGRPLGPGLYKIDVEMTLPGLQSDQVRAVVGDRGQKMSGALVVKVMSNLTVSYSANFQLGSAVPAHAPVPAQSKSYEPIPPAWGIRVDLPEMLTPGAEYCTQDGHCTVVDGQHEQRCREAPESAPCFAARIPVQVLAASPAGSGPVSC